MSTQDLITADVLAGDVVSSTRAASTRAMADRPFGWMPGSIGMHVAYMGARLGWHGSVDSDGPLHRVPLRPKDVVGS